MGKERHATAGRWVRYFREEEGVRISAYHIRRRLTKAGVIGETVRSPNGNACLGGYFSEADVREYCADLLENPLQVDENGFVIIDRERYASPDRWGEYFLSEEGIRISSGNILKSLTEAGLIGQTVRGRNGRVCPDGYFSEADARQYCADLLEDILQADEHSFATVEKERYATPCTWSEHFRKEIDTDISSSTIKRRLEAAGMTAQDAKTRRGRVGAFFSESQVREVCGELLQELPVANEEGFINLDGKIFGTIAGIARRLDVSHATVHNKLKSSGLLPIKGKNSLGRINPLYSEEHVRALCQDFLDVPRADEEGLIFRDGKTYGTIRGLSKFLGISCPTIYKAIDEHSIRSIPGRTFGGIKHDFYSEEDLREFCRELLDTVPLADANGLIIKDSQTYGTFRSLSRVLEFSEITVKKLVLEHSPHSIRGRVAACSVYDFYSEEDIRKLYQLQFENFPKADANGLIFLDGRTYGTPGSLSRLYGISRNSMVSRINRHSPEEIQGTDTSGVIRTFYLATEVKRLCADLIAKKNK